MARPLRAGCARLRARSSRALLEARRWLAPERALRAPDLDPATLGLLGERLVGRALRRQGWRLLGARLVTRAAELDLCLLDDEVLVAVEVKTGRAPDGIEPEAAVAGWRPGVRFRTADLERVRRAAARLGEDTGRAWRVDLVELVVTPSKVHFFHHVDLRAALSPPAPRADLLDATP